MLTDSFTQQSNDRQNKVQAFAFCLAVSMAVLFSIFFVVPNLLGSGQSHEIALDSRVNPNDASVSSLIRLPGIGISRADGIVAYRESFIEKSGPGPAFRNCDDLQKVKGIGPKTAQNICEWLKFE
jgi:competence ComEA-like helix-hairpin-helix protein